MVRVAVCIWNMTNKLNICRYNKLQTENDELKIVYIHIHEIRDCYGKNLDH